MNKYLVIFSFFQLSIYMLTLLRIDSGGGSIISVTRINTVIGNGELGNTKKSKQSQFPFDSLTFLLGALPFWFYRFQ